jgi:hypothetical protein
MILSHAQMTQATAAARALVAAHSTGFINYNNMVSDDQLAQAIAQVLAKVTVDAAAPAATPKPPAQG